MQELSKADFYQGCTEYFICYLWNVQLPGGYISTYYKAKVKFTAILMSWAAVNYGDN